MKHKRAPGGGRKPKVGIATSSLTIRIPDDMRLQLESEADAKNESVAQRLLWHLRQSFNREDERKRDPAMRALCFLIARLADDVVGLYSEGKPEFSWRSDPFFFRAFKIAVAKLLDALEPKGEMRVPQIPEPFKSHAKEQTGDSLLWRFYQSYKTPEDRGQVAAEYVWGDMQRYSQMSPHDVAEEDRRLPDEDFDPLEAYALVGVAHDLQLTKLRQALEQKPKTAKG
jgi:hypothetical protein